MLSRDDVDTLIGSLTSVIPSGFFYAMGQRESNLNPNNVTPEGNGTTSIGVWQVNAEEAAAAGVTGDLKDPSNNASVIVYKMTQNLYALANKYGFNAEAPPDDAWYYLAASHNAGLSRIEGWIDETGVDWQATKAKHPTFVTIAKGYADYIGNAAIADLPSIADGPPDGTGDSGGPVTDTILVLLIVGIGVVFGVLYA